MELQEFVSKVADQYFDTPHDIFTADTDFRQLDEWSSFVNLCIWAMIKDEYDVLLDPNVMKECRTIRHLFEAVSSKIQK